MLPFVFADPTHQLTAFGMDQLLVLPFTNTWLSCETHAHLTHLHTVSNQQ